MSNIKKGKKKDKDIFSKVSELIEKAREKIASTINEEMIILYWNIGKIIKEDIMRSDRAEYGKQIVQSLIAQLQRNSNGQGQGNRHFSPSLTFRRK